MATWARAGAAVGSELHAFLSGTSAADQPVDIVHVRNQDLIVRTATPGGWRPLPEASLDDPRRGSRSIDVLLERGPVVSEPREMAIMEVIDFFLDVGATIRSWDRRLATVESRAIARIVGDEPLPRVSGCWIVRATRRNRDLIRAHAALFHARLPGSPSAWLRALAEPGTRMPDQPALL